MVCVKSPPSHGFRAKRLACLFCSRFVSRVYADHRRAMFFLLLSRVHAGGSAAQSVRSALKPSKSRRARKRNKMTTRQRCTGSHGVPIHPLCGARSHARPLIYTHVSAAIFPCSYTRTLIYSLSRVLDRSLGYSLAHILARSYAPSLAHGADESDIEQIEFNATDIV